MNSKLLLRIGINTLIGVILIAVWIHFVNLSEIAESLQKVNPLIILPCLAFFALSGIFRAWRLKILLCDNRVILKELIYLTYLSQLLSFVIPIRAGEITKGVYLSSHFGMKLGKGVVLIFLDRFFDFLLVVVMSLMLLMVVPNNLPKELIKGLGIILILFIFLTFLIFLFSKELKKILLSLKILLFFSFVKRIYVQIVELIFEVVDLLKNNRSNLWKIIFLTLFATIGEALVWLTLLSSLLPSVNFFQTLLGSMLTALTFLIPAAPGYVGSAEAGGQVVFNLGLGLDKTGVAASTLLYHAIVLLFLLVFGLLGLYLLKLDLRLIWSKLKASRN